MVVDRRQRIRDYIANAKIGKKCQNCPVDDPRVLDFHHLRDKHIKVSDIPKMKWGIKRTQLELDKCVLLCANCHRKEHISLV